MSSVFFWLVWPEKTEFSMYTSMLYIRRSLESSWPPIGWVGTGKLPTLNNNQTKPIHRQTTLNDLWDLNRTLIVTYQVTQWSDSQEDFPSRLTKHCSQADTVESRHEMLWPEVIHAWGNTRDASRLFRFLNRSMGQKRSATFLWVAMTHLTPR